jgi:SAM-dependent methyltransferase
MEIESGDRVLEIGCGRGVAISLVCEHLINGTITAVDRSRTAVEGAINRNREAVATGKARILAGEIGDVDLGSDRYHKIFAVNVNLFWVRSPAVELDLVKRLLRPGAALYVFYEPPDAGRTAELTANVMTALGERGFTTSVLTSGSAKGMPLVGIVGRPR